VDSVTALAALDELVLWVVHVAAPAVHAEPHMQDTLHARMQQHWGFAMAIQHDVMIIMSQ
jgi:hypothetical protein